MQAIPVTVDGYLLSSPFRVLAPSGTRRHCCQRKRDVVRSPRRLGVGSYAYQQERLQPPSPGGWDIRVRGFSFFYEPSVESGGKVSGGWVGGDPRTSRRQAVPGGEERPVVRALQPHRSVLSFEAQFTVSGLNCDPRVSGLNFFILLCAGSLFSIDLLMSRPIDVSG